MLPTKIVIIGAGSAIFGLNTVAALLRSERLRGSHLALVDHNAETLGLIARLAVRLNREWQADLTITKTDGVTRDECFALSEINYIINYSPVIYIASDYKDMGCRYSQTLAHEKRHVEIGKRVYNQFLPEIKEELTSAVRTIKPQGPYPSERVEAERQRVMDEIRAATRPIIDRLHEKMRVEQGAE